MDSAELDGSPAHGAIGMCYVVVTPGEPSNAGADLRVRFEFRADLADGRSETRTVLGAGAACEAMREWLDQIAD